MMRGDENLVAQGGDDLVRSRPKRRCEICGNETTRLLFEQSFCPIADAGLLPGYQVVVCKNCGFAFADRIPEQSAFDVYYRDISKYERQHLGGRESTQDTQRLAAIRDILQSLIPSKEARVLEIGCANGALLALLKEDGYTRISGLDPSPSSAETARELYGISVKAGTISDLSEGHEFDVLIMMGVLEHIRDLGLAVDKVSAALSANGRAIFAVPDASRFADFPGAPFQEFSPEHLNFFSETSLTNLMGVHGFRAFNTSHAVVRDSATDEVPVVFGAYECTSEPSPLLRDSSAEKGLSEYVRISRMTEDRIRRIIIGLASEGLETVVWGAGAHTQRLLSTGDLCKVKIAAFVDSNPKYQGKRLNGLPILPPQALAGRSEPILISTRVFQREIERQIREDLKLSNELILLYDI